MTEILPNLILGSLDESFDRNILKKYNVSHILNVANEINIDNRVGLLYKKYGIDDDDDNSDIRVILDDCIDFIKNAHENNGIVFVHCWFGMSRSVCIILVYMVIVLNWEFNDVYIHIKNLRPIIDVWELYLIQIKQYIIESKNKLIS